MRNEALIATRKRVGKTQEQVAKDAQIAAISYQTYERGIRTPNIFSAIRVADALGIQDVRELWKSFDEEKE